MSGWPFQSFRLHPSALGLNNPCAAGAIFSALLFAAAPCAKASGRSEGKTGADQRWSITIYGGPWTQRVFSEIVGRGRFAVSGGMLAAAADFRMARLGWGFSLDVEGQATQTVSGHSFQTFALGIGLEFDGFPWRKRLPMTISLYTGPSYAIDPPREYYDPGRSQHPFLNYVGAELAIGLPGLPNWDGAFRFYHRSGVWGLYSINADEGSTIGAGLRYRW